jgi:hypothetical protein
MTNICIATGIWWRTTLASEELSRHRNPLRKKCGFLRSRRANQPYRLAG